MSNKRKYTKSEKAKIALDAIRGELTIAQIASKYGVHSTQIHNWKKQALTQLPESFSDKDKQIKSQHESEIAKLYEQIGRLQVENDFLKKKCDVFG